MSQPSDTPQSEAQPTISRRRALKGLGTAALGVGGITAVGSGPAAAAKVSIGLWPTDYVYNNYSGSPLYAVGEHLKKGIDPDGDAYYWWPYEDKPFKKDGDWDTQKYMIKFYNWLDNNGYLDNEDYHLLIGDVSEPTNSGDLNHDLTGAADEGYGVAGIFGPANPDPGNNKSYQEWWLVKENDTVKNEWAKVISGAYHELGHLWNGSGSKKDHKHGFYVTCEPSADQTETYLTPMMHTYEDNYDGETNVCGTPIEYAEGSAPVEYRYISLAYSRCMADNTSWPTDPPKHVVKASNKNCSN